MTATDTEVDRLIDAATTKPPAIPQDLVAQVAAGDLLDALRWVKHAVPVKPPVPVFSCVHLSAHAGGLRLQAFDYEVHAAQVVPAVGATGSALVSWRFLREAIATLPKRAEVHLHVDDSTLVVEGDGFTWRIPTGPLEELPALPDTSTAREVATFTGDAFTALTAPSRAASWDETLPILTGVMLDQADSADVEAYATDRYRLAHTRIAATVHHSGWKVLVPARQLAVAAAAFRREPTVRLWLDEQTCAAGKKLTPALDRHRVYLRAGQRSLSMLSIEGDYPKVLQLFPGEPKNVLELDRLAMVTALRRATVVTGPRRRGAPGTGPARLDVTARGTGAASVDLSAGWDDTTSGSGRLDADHVVGKDDFSMGYNPHFLIEALANFTSARIRLSVTEPNKPVILTAAPATDPDATTTPVTDPLRLLIMPMRLAG